MRDIALGRRAPGRFFVFLSLAVSVAVLGLTGARASGGAAPARAKDGPAGTGHTLAATAGTRSVSGTTRLGFCGGDDWEPEIAVSGTYVYAVLSHFVGDTSCDAASGNPRHIYIQVSSNSGATFGAPHVVPVPAGLPYPSVVDCVVTVDPVTGAVYVSFLGYGLGGNTSTDVVVAKSTDHGATFSVSKKVNGPECTNCDHPWTLAYNGNVYVTYASGPNHYLSRSSDGGLTWTETNVLRDDHVAFPEGGVLDAAGNAYFAWGDCSGSCSGKQAAVYKSSKTLAGTSTTTFSSVADAPSGPDCVYHGSSCGFAYWGPQNDIAMDSAGTLYMVWQDAQDPTHPKSPPIVQLSKSTDGGSTWQYVGRVDDKTATGCAGSECYALYPRVEAAGPGQVSVMWMDDRLGSPLDHSNGWNVWVRSSTTGGATWTGPSRRVSAYDPSRRESQPNGFLFPYGDYEGLARAGSKLFMVWGEGVNYLGGPSNPGHVIYGTASA